MPDGIHRYAMDGQIIETLELPGRTGTRRHWTIRPDAEFKSPLRHDMIGGARAGQHRFRVTREQMLDL